MNTTANSATTSHVSMIVRAAELAMSLGVALAFVIRRCFAYQHTSSPLYRSVVFCALLAGCPLYQLEAAETATSPPPKIDPNLDEKGDAYMSRHAAALLDEVSRTLRQFPPQQPEPRERYLALLLLDSVLHDTHAAQRPPVQTFFRNRIETALAEMEATRVEEGAQIWKLYNMGFIVRTKSVTLAFDLVSGRTAGSTQFELSSDVMARLARQCDVLFISHRHRDHAEETVAQLFLSQGKPVVAPPQVFADRLLHASLTHLQRTAHVPQSLRVQDGKQELKVVVYPGHQMGAVENNVSLVITPEGLSFAHLGDQINEGDFMVDYGWIDEVGKHHRVDVLMPPCWTNEIFRIAKGFNPRLILPGHENELGHPVDDRVPFWGDADYLQLTYPELKRSNYRTIVMTWGESVRYLPAAK
jgi:L-ascorbate metabolism protein UlaG (beta-lactamase superfamily)